MQMTKSHPIVQFKVNIHAAAGTTVKSPFWGQTRHKVEHLFTLLLYLNRQHRAICRDLPQVINSTFHLDILNCSHAHKRRRCTGLAEVRMNPSWSEITSLAKAPTGAVLASQTDETDGK